MKELLNSFYMNSRTVGFDSQTTFFVKKTKKATHKSTRNSMAFINL